MKLSASAIGKIITTILALIIVVFPSLPTLSFISPELWRVIILLVLAGLGLGVILILVSMGTVIKWRSNLISIGLLIWTLVTLAAAAFSPTFLKSIGSPETYLPLAILILYTLTLSLTESTGRLLKVAFFIGATGLAIFTLVVTVSPLKSLGMNVTVGSNSLVFLISAVILLVLTAVEELKKKSRLVVPTAIGAVIIMTALAVMIGGMAGLSPFKERVTKQPEVGVAGSWLVAAESIKNRPFFGVGVRNFQSLYTQVRPTLQVFAAANNQYFESLATSGIVGLAAIIILMLSILLTALKHRRADVLAFATVFIIGSLVTPFTVSNLLIVVVIGGLLAGVEGGWEHLNNPQTPIGKTVAAVIGAILIAVIYFPLRALAADINFLQSYSIKSDNLQGILDMQQTAVNLNPLNDSYRRTYAGTALAIAKLISQKQTLADQDKTNINALAQIAVTQSDFITTRLDPYSALNWQLRASVYDAMKDSDQNALTGALTSYKQAINLDPYNVQTRISLGDLLISQKSYQEAAQIYQGAINVDNSSTQAHYDLGLVLAALKNYPGAIQEIGAAKSLLDEQKSPDDFAAVSKTLAELQALVASSSAKTATTSASKR
ncbi:MAG: tetratricopeptide repeat protein [candidate division WWE3 bacterium]|nr:tetratricopeptide repeat protein [candidate division WWE3 bacterium]